MTLGCGHNSYQFVICFCWLHQDSNSSCPNLLHHARSVTEDLSDETGPLYSIDSIASGLSIILETSV
ncbi:hypothetical protein RRG08_031031 [Elysia crispata]|uniref:Uncharacterized protein n=1 Tax=Elysia crispata TaxID=231223 RepID=A0AAE0ZH16_9GAST|nr:hypothetical protein RRG08_031031 [Elysia crispata]